MFNTSALNSVIPVQITHICDSHRTMIGWKTIGNLLSQGYHVKWWPKCFAETLKKVFSNEEKLASGKIFRLFLHMNSTIIIIFI